MTGINPINFANKIAEILLVCKPETTPQDLQVEVRNRLQELKRNGAKISDKKIAQVCAQVPEIHKATLEQIKANTVAAATPKAQTAVKTLNNAQAATAYQHAGWVADVKADRHYNELGNMSKKARRNLYKRNMADAKAAFADERFAEPKLETASNNQAKKQANAEYQSSKKQKAAKKQAEIKSQAEHNAQKPIKNKKIRKARNNARYCTSQGIMTQDARKAFRNVSKDLDGRINLTVKDTPNQTLQKMADYYRNLEASSVAAPVAPKVQLPEGYSTITKPFKINLPKAAETAAPKATEAVAETATKLKGKGGKIGWIAAGLAALVGGASLLGSKKPEEIPQEQISEVA